METILNADRDAAIAELEAFYVEQEEILFEEGYSYYATDSDEVDLDDYPTFLANVSWISEEGVMVAIYSGHGETAIYEDEMSNIRFRFWHDIVHLEHNLSFSHEDEQKAAMIMMIEAEHAGLSQLARRILAAETSGMNIYFKTRKDFPKNQAGFIDSCLRVGAKIASKVVH